MHVAYLGLHQNNLVLVLRWWKTLAELHWNKTRFNKPSSMNAIPVSFHNSGGTMNRSCRRSVDQLNDLQTIVLLFNSHFREEGKAADNKDAMTCWSGLRGGAPTSNYWEWSLRWLCRAIISSNAVSSAIYDASSFLIGASCQRLLGTFNHEVSRDLLCSKNGGPPTTVS